MKSRKPAFPGKKKRKSKLKPMDVLKKYDLTLQQERFCQYYVTPGEFFGNGTQSYAHAYDIDLVFEPKRSFMVANAASKLLKEPKICKRINDLLEGDGFNDLNVDKQLNFLINQFTDLPTKLNALKEYNKLRNRITDRIQHEVKTPITTINILPPVQTREDLAKTKKTKKDDETTPE